MPSTDSAATTRTDSVPAPARRRGGRRSKRMASEGIRYFVAKPGAKHGTLALEEELASEPEALVAAFKSDSRVFAVMEYMVVQKIDGNSVSLVKEPAPPTQRVSTTNAS